ncbi:hypothetical protein [Gordonia iterans]
MVDRDDDSAPAPHRKLRTVCCLVLVVLGLLLAPVAVAGAWARGQLVDSGRFVATFAPLAAEPHVQDFVAAQLSDRAVQQLDPSRRVAELFDTLQDGSLPPRAAAGIGLLEAPTVAGLENLIENTAQRLVTSPQFADLWAASLRLSHRQVTRVLDDDPRALADLSTDGVLSLRLDPVYDALRVRLVERGLPFAERLVGGAPQAVPILHADALGLVQAVYDAAVIGGFWLPWAVLVLLAAGVLIAVSPRRALSGMAAAFAVVFGLMSVGIWVGRTAFVSAIAPATMPPDVAGAIFDQVSALMSAAVVALTVLGALIAVGTWMAGPARPARALRDVAGAGFASIRSALDAHGGDTGRVGAVVERWRHAIVSVAVLLGLAGLVATRPVSVAGVVWLVVGLILLLVAIELIRRPAAADDLTEPV